MALMPDEFPQSVSLTMNWALRDPTAAGDYWIWQAGDVPEELLSRSLRRIQESHPPEQANSWTTEDCVAGVLTLGMRQCVIYRYFNGGRDSMNRPDRSLLLMAIVDRDRIQEVDLEPVFDGGLFGVLAQLQPLPLAMSAPQFPIEILLPLRKGNVPLQSSGLPAEFHGPTALRRAWEACSMLPRELDWNLTFQRMADQSVVQITAVPDHRILPNPPPHSPRHRSTNSLPVRDPSLPMQSSPFLPRRRAMISLVFLLSGGMVGFWIGQFWTAGTLDGTQTQWRESARLWAESYQSPETGQLIPRKELIERLETNTWTPSLPHQPPAVEFTEDHQTALPGRSPQERGSIGPKHT